MTDPELLGLLRVPRHGGGGAIDLVGKAVLPTRTELGDRHNAACSALEAQEDGRHVLRVDLDRDGLRGALRGEGAHLSLIHISEPTRLGMISYAVFCLN